MSAVDPGGPEPHVVPRLRRSIAIGHRAEALRRFGYSAHDAEFLTFAALLGGYFERRHYRAWGGRRPGSAEMRMIRRGLENRHLVSFADNRLWHIRSRALHAAVGSDAAAGTLTRARRGVKQRLFMVDHLLATPDGPCWLLTADAKRRHCQSLGVPAACLPAGPRTRRGVSPLFPDRFPIRMACADPPVVELLYAHTGSTPLGARRFLDRHAALAASLWARGIACEWTVLADGSMQFPRLRQAWRRWRGEHERTFQERECFGLRRTMQKRAWDSISAGQVERYVQLASLVESEGLERRYQEWLDADAPAPQPGADFASASRYREVLLEQDYSTADWAS